MHVVHLGTRANVCNRFHGSARQWACSAADEVRKIETEHAKTTRTSNADINEIIQTLYRGIKFALCKYAKLQHLM
jgi:hypothetical protein